MITILTSKEFENLYPNAFESVSNKYNNLPYSNFVIIEKDCYVSICNETGDCWTEEFKTLQAAVKDLL